MYSIQDMNSQIISLLNNILSKSEGDFGFTEVSFLAIKFDGLDVGYKSRVAGLRESSVNSTQVFFITLYTELNYLIQAILWRAVHMFRPGFLLKTRCKIKTDYFYIQ